MVDTNFPYIERRVILPLVYIDRGRKDCSITITLYRERKKEMNKTRTCSKCGKVTKITMKGVTECPKCGTPFKPQTPTARKSK